MSSGLYPKMDAQPLETRNLLVMRSQCHKPSLLPAIARLSSRSCVLLTGGASGTSEDGTAAPGRWRQTHRRPSVTVAKAMMKTARVERGNTMFQAGKRSHCKNGLLIKNDLFSNPPSIVQESPASG